MSEILAFVLAGALVAGAIIGAARLISDAIARWIDYRQGAARRDDPPCYVGGPRITYITGRVDRGVVAGVWRTRRRANRRRRAKLRAIPGPGSGGDAA